MSGSPSATSTADSTLLERAGLSDVAKGLVFLGLMTALLVHPVSGSGRLTPFEMLFVLICGVWLVRTLRVSPVCTLRLGPVERGFVFFGVAVVLSCFYNLLAPGGVAALGGGIEIDGAFLVRLELLGFMAVAVCYGGYRLASQTVRTRRDLEHALLTVVAAVTVNALVTDIVWLVQTGGVIGRYNFEHYLTHSPGTSIWMSSIGFVLALTLLLHGRRSRFRAFALVTSIGVLFLSIVVTVTRQTQVSFLVLLTLTLFLSRRSLPPRAARLGFTLAVLLGGLLLALVLTGRATGLLSPYRLLSGTDARDIVVRRTMLVASWDMFRSSPLFGIGYGFFAILNTTPVQVTGATFYLASPHNGIAAIGAELGVAGLLAAGLLIGAAFFQTRRILHRSVDGLAVGYSSFVVALIVVESGNQFLSNSMFIPLPIERSTGQLSFIVWFLIGAAASLARPQMSNPAE
jgi:O-antigen ligase